MAVSDVIRIQLFSHAHDRQFINTFHYRETVGDSGPNNLAGINIAFGAQVVANFDQFLSNEVVIGCSIANEIIAAGPRRIPNTVYYVDEFGFNVGDSMPGNTVARVNLYGQHQSRPNRGALILSGLTESGAIGNEVNPATIALIQTNLIDNLIADLVGGAPSTGEWEFGYMSRAAVVAGDPPVPWPGAFVKPTGYVVSPQYGTLRSRQTTYTAVRGS